MENEKPLEIMVEEITAAEPEVREFDMGSQLEIKVSLPYNNFIKAVIKEGRANIEYFLVQEEVRRKGVGERLMRRLALELKKREAKFLTGSLESEGALRTRLKVFGEDNVSLHPDVELLGEDARNKQLTVDEAIEDFKKKQYVYSEVDLGKIDTSNWETNDKSRTQS